MIYSYLGCWSTVPEIDGSEESLGPSSRFGITRGAVKAEIVRTPLGGGNKSGFLGASEKACKQKPI